MIGTVRTSVNTSRSADAKLVASRPDNLEPKLFNLAEDIGEAHDMTDAALRKAIASTPSSTTNVHSEPISRSSVRANVPASSRRCPPAQKRDRVAARRDRNPRPRRA